MKVYFKSGNTVEISQEVAELINNNLANGLNGFASFCHSNTGKVYLFINLQEVEFIL